MGCGARDQCPRRLACAGILTALPVAALLAACGGSGAREGQAYHRAVNAAACIRTHGVPNYAEPKLVNGTIKLSFTASVNPTTPAVQTAAKKCGYKAEQQAGETSSRIVFARCMRTHGVKNFPYPSAQSGVSPAMVQAEGINMQSPAVVRAVAACLPPHGSGRQRPLDHARRPRSPLRMHVKAPDDRLRALGWPRCRSR